MIHFSLLYIGNVNVNHDAGERRTCAAASTIGDPSRASAEHSRLSALSKNPCLNGIRSDSDGNAQNLSLLPLIYHLLGRLSSPRATFVAAQRICHC